MAQQFKALAALTEGLSSANSTQVTQLTNKHLLIPALGESSALFWLLRVLHSDAEGWYGRKKVYILSHDLNIYIYNI